MLARRMFSSPRKLALVQRLIRWVVALAVLVTSTGVPVAIAELCKDTCQDCADESGSEREGDCDCPFDCRWCCTPALPRAIAPEHHGAVAPPGLASIAPALRGDGRAADGIGIEILHVPKSAS